MSFANATQARAIAFSDRHMMLSEMVTNGRRLSDLVNDPLKRHLTLEHVRVNRPEIPDETVGSFDQLTIKKDAVQGILVLFEPPRQTQQRLASYVAKSPVRIAVVLPAFLMVGLVHLAGKTDPALWTLDGNGESFAVISQADVTLTGRQGAPICVPIALINRSHIEAVGSVE